MSFFNCGLADEILGQIIVPVTQLSRVTLSPLQGEPGILFINFHPNNDHNMSVAFPPCSEQHKLILYVFTLFME